jgi:hypothetical protein
MREPGEPEDYEAEYEAALREWAALTDAGAAAADRNEQADRRQRAYLRIRMTPSGRAVVSRLANDPNPRIRGWAATDMLAWDPERGRATLARLWDLGGAGSFEAKVTLMEHDAGKLRLDWDPNVRDTE